MNSRPDPSALAQAVAAQYAARAVDGRYSFLRPDVYLSVQERQRALLRLFNRLGLSDLGKLRLLELGCGVGGNLLELLRLGFAADHLSGIELLAERYAQARFVLPQAVQLWQGDATALSVPEQSQDMVLVSTVFSSLLDDDYQELLARTLWPWIKPGGGVLWYDFTVNNPRNADVRGVPLDRVRALFPHGRHRAERVTLAPPIARCVARIHPALYTVFNLLPVLRTHVLVWIEKP